MTLDQVRTWIEFLPAEERRCRAMQQACVELGHVLRPDDYPLGPLPWEPEPDTWAQAWGPYVEEAKRAILGADNAER